MFLGENGQLKIAFTFLSRPKQNVSRFWQKPDKFLIVFILKNSPEPEGKSLDDVPSVVTRVIRLCFCACHAKMHICCLWQPGSRGWFIIHRLAF
jgi:hypothetical protein